MWLMEDQGDAHACVSRASKGNYARVELVLAPAWRCGCLADRSPPADVAELQLEVWVDVPQQCIRGAAFPHPACIGSRAGVCAYHWRV